MIKQPQKPRYNSFQTYLKYFPIDLQPIYFSEILTKNRQNSRKVNRLEFNWKIFQISLETVISRFLGLFDHLEKVLKISDECLFREPCSLQGTNAKIRPKSPQIGGRKIQKETSIKYIVNKYIIIYYYILLYITIQYYYILLLYIIYNYHIIIIIIIWCFELTFGLSESGN